MALTKEYKIGMDFTAKTFAGLEEELAKELKLTGAEDIEIIKRGVKFRGDIKVMYKANYLCRTALRILKPIGVFEIKDDKQLYEKVKNIDWTKVFNIDQTFIVEANLFHSELSHSHFVALRTKDAIVDQFRDKTGKRPWVGREDADIFIDVHMSHNVCTVSLDSSGESLHRRGYRIAADKAPINEVLAAGMVKLTGWKGDKDFYDPMCGSGTIPIEAAMLAMNIPSGYYRKKYAFMNWADYNEELWKEVKAEEDLNMTDMECSIYASDRSVKAIAIAKQNLKNTGLHKDIEVKVQYFDSILPPDKKGVLVFNPPYGQRLEEKGDIFKLYRGIGDVLKQNFTGFEAWMISSNIDAAKFVGLRPSTRITLFNGPIETKFIKFEMYDGSKKEKYDGKPGERRGLRRPDVSEQRDYQESDDKEGKSFRRRDDGDKKPFRRKDDDNRRDFRKRDDGDKKDFRKRDEGERRGFRRKEDGDKKPFRRKDDDSRRDFRKRDDGDKKDFRKRDDGERRGFRRKDDSEKKPFRRRDDDSRKDFRKRDDGDNKGFRKRDESERRYSKRKDDDNKKDFRRRDDGKKFPPKSSDNIRTRYDSTKKPPPPEIRSLKDEKEAED